MVEIFSIEGKIGSGKTTLLHELKDLKFSKPHLVIFEQVNEWSKIKDEDGKDILSLFYSDTKKYSYVFQTHVLLSRMVHLLKTMKENPDSIIICERCHLTDLYVFATSLYKQKNMNSIEWIIYQKWHDQLKEFIKIEITGYIYVKTDAKVCYERIKKRSRTGEDEIPLDYLQLLEDNHDRWLMNRPIQNEDVEWFSLKRNFITPVIVINGNVDYYDINERTKQKESIIKFVNYEITQ